MSLSSSQTVQDLNLHCICLVFIPPDFVIIILVLCCQYFLACLITYDLFIFALCRPKCFMNIWEQEFKVYKIRKQ